MNHRFYKENQNKFLECFQRGLLVKNCRIIKNQIVIETVAWEEYWKKFELGKELHTETYSFFKQAFKDLYISKFNNSKYYMFCKSYYSLLKDTFERPQISDRIRLEALQVIISFGNFPILNKSGVAIAAVTFNLNNPNYLISKINRNMNLEDAKYLPIVTVNDFTNQPSLFFHYRQIPLKIVPGGRLFFYVPEKISLRFEAFVEIKKVIDALYYKPDTLLKTRAKYLAETVVYPILKKVLKKQSSPVRILDLGGGSGFLIANIIEIISKLDPDLIPDNSIEWNLLDVPGLTYDAIFKRKNICRKIIKFQYIRSDFRAWILENSDKMVKYDLIFCCRIINTASLVSIEKTSDDSVIKKMLPEDYKNENYIFDIRGYSLIDNNHIMINKSRIRLNSGYTYKQISNSQYYRTLYCIKHQHIFPPTEIYYPYRKVNINKLFDSSKKSFLETLCKRGRYVIIEDVDLDYRDLLEHFHLYNLNLVVRDLTSALKLTTSHLFCISETFS